MKITIPINSAKNGGALYTLVDDLTNINNEVEKNNDGTNLTLDDSPAQNKIDLDQSTLLTILGETGDVENHLMAIKMPTSFANTVVPVGVPYRENVVGNARTFDEWFITGSEVWIDNTNNQFVFYTNPLGTVADISQYLKGSEMEIIRQLDAANISILNLTEAQVEVNDPAKDYIKVVW